MTYDVIHGNRACYVVIATGFATVQEAKLARLVTGDLVVHSTGHARRETVITHSAKTRPTIAQSRAWLSLWERRDKTSYAYKCLTANAIVY